MDPLKAGAHMSSAGGYAEAVKRVKDIGGNCLQLFSTSPRGWKTADISEEESQQFRRTAEELAVSPVYFHASYLINLAGSEENQQKSVNSLTAELQTAGRCGIRGSVIHLGSFLKDKKSKDGKGEDDTKYDPKKYQGLVKNIKTILGDTPEDTLFIIENMGTRKIGRTLEEIALIVEETANPRVRVCLDTCHLHAAGYDISGPDKLSAFLEKFDQLIGLDRLEVIHINDSRDPFGSLRDRHENLGEGEIEEEVFQALLCDPQTAGLPFILETPGFGGGGPDAKNLDRLIGYRQ